MGNGNEPKVPQAAPDELLVPGAAKAKEVDVTQPDDKGKRGQACSVENPSCGEA